MNSNSTIFEILGWWNKYKINLYLQQKSDRWMYERIQHQQRLINHFSWLYIPSKTCKYDGKQWGKSFSNIINNQFPSFQSVVNFFYSRNLQDDKYLKIYEFSIKECTAGTSVNLIQNPLLSPILEVINQYVNFGSLKCPVQKGRRGLNDNATIPVSVLPLMGMKRKLKVTLKGMGLPASKKWGTLYNCSIYVLVWRIN